jgi:hypothetical protein
MNNMPGFTADVSLYRTSGHYRSDRNGHAVNLTAQTITAIHPAAAMVGEEVIVIEDEAPWGLPWGWGPGGWTGGGGGGGVPTGPTDWGGGGGGGGGGGTPASVPADIVSACLKIGGRFGEKYCGGVGGPSSCKTCAQIVCQQKKCKATKRCDPSDLNGRKEQACDVGCPDVPGCKDGLTVRSSVITGGHGGILL